MAQRFDERLSKTDRAVNACQAAPPQLDFNQGQVPGIA